MLKTTAQQEKINWINFEQLQDSLNAKPKKVLISFYADWCSYCKKMDEAAYKDSEVISLINTKYYAVKMNSESTETIVFDGKEYANEEYGKVRNPTHEIPKLLASRKGYPFTLPATVIVNESFEITQRYFEYISPKKMRRILKRK